MDLIQAIIIAIIEGLTEYLPVSSTAHMIFTSSILDSRRRICENVSSFYSVWSYFGGCIFVLEKIL
jgi:undecaprenyl-diphosphatase